MGFYKDGRWQPDATEIASGEYRMITVEDSLRRRIAELETENTAYLRAYEKMAKENQRMRQVIKFWYDEGYNRLQAEKLLEGE